ncbi:hypothetical protein J2S43_001225 [Catenuloplanes nepalensis]|uniref:Uncharacterized protein n=1 Tax=Catenuloplanes nepalensis TaxID=587533 RepID=A0ABT9MMP3_9ACTN|nr:hypothetical protein [Catenuloplanes nepalensis]
MTAGPDRAGRDAERLGGLRDRVPPQVDVVQHGAVHGRQPVQRVPERGPLGQVRRFVRDDGQDGRDGHGEPAGAGRVDDQVAGHGEQPATDRAGAGPQPVRVPPGPQQRLLHHVLGERAVTGEAGGVGEQRASVLAVQLTQERLVAGHAAKRTLRMSTNHRRTAATGC